MRRLTLSVITPIALAFSMLMATPAYARQDVDAPGQDQPVIQRRIPEAARSGALPFVRTELFFGTAKPDGVVTDGEFRDFVDYVVTPRFPDGLTLLQGDGQFRGADNVIIKEASYVLILLYPVDTQKVSAAKIDSIRRLYMRRFQQQSVLRVDDPFVVWVSF